MYNKYIFINNYRKKQKAQEEAMKKKEESTQLSFDMLEMQKQSNESIEGNIITQNINSKNPMTQNSNFKKTNQKAKNLLNFVDDYVLVDIETTGLSPINDDIIEIGAIKVVQNKIVDTYNELIRINKRLPDKIVSLTGITDEMLRNGRMPSTVLKEFVNFVNDNVIIGHNVNFDLGFLCDKCKKYLDYNLNNDYIDTLYLARKLVPNSINHKLGTLAKYFNISYAGAHRGLKDVEITYEVYNNLRKLSKN